MYPGAGGTGGMMGGQQGAGQMLGQGMVMPSQMLGGMPIMDMSAFGGVDMSQLSSMVGGAVPIMPMGSTAAGMSAMGGMPPMAGMPGMMPGMGGMGGMGGGMGMAPGGGDDNAFYKTRICHKWQEGKCNYGPGCRYAHGEADLRPSVGNAGGGARAPSAPRTMGGGGSGGAGGAKTGPNVEIHKTRLCERFMSTGMCPYLGKCTFAHGHEELRQPGQLGAVHGAMGGGARSAPLVVPTNPQGGPVIGPPPRPGGGADGGAGTKRRRMDGGGGGGGGGGSEAVVPPEYELLPAEGAGADLAWLQQRFQALKNEINAFAAETGHSVAVFTIGGLVSSDPDTPPDDPAAEAIVRAAPSASRPSLKLSVLKYGSGGVARQLVQRQEIVKFVCARGSKALAELGDREADPHLAGL